MVVLNESHPLNLKASYDYKKSFSAGRTPFQI